MNIFRWLKQTTVVGILAGMLAWPLTPSGLTLINTREGATPLERAIPLTAEKGGEGQETHG
jgi:hypothetical protein